MSDQPGLTTAEVAELLGVKRQTVYAYVSRGILHRQVSVDGRTSLFDRAEVEELRLGRRAPVDGELRTILSTRITRVADEGLWIRGHDVVQLVENGAGFAELVEVVWDGSTTEVWPELPVVHGIAEVIDCAEPANLQERLRVGVAWAGAQDPLRHDLGPRSVRAAGRRAMTAMVGALQRPGHDRDSTERARQADQAADLTPSTPLVAALWPRLSGDRVEPERLRALDIALALLVDHGLAASTLAARVAASVRADPYSVIGAGLGVLGGPLHGAASASVHQLYQAAADQGAANAVGHRQRQGLDVPGFGHAVYQTQDPRYGALMNQLVQGWADDRRLTTVFQVRDVLDERSHAVPNIDLALGALTFLADMPEGAGEVLFAIARTAGWLAHAMEEYEEKPLRFRPRARYLGPRPPHR